jgi:alcohol dehydrogenase (cytochrome c)
MATSTAFRLSSFAFVACLFSCIAHAEGVYTEAQANTGKQTFDVACSECHHATLKGTGHGPELAGPNFLAKWGEHTAGDIATQITTKMPPTAPHSLSDTVAAAITAHILRANGAPAGSTELRANSITKIGVAVMGEKWLASMAVPANTKVESWAGAASISAAAEKASGFVNRTVEHFTPVTDEMLRHPADGDWLSWRRTQDGQGYSPLAQVNKKNVKKLRLAWVMTMHEGSNQGTPLVHDGIMYLTHPGNIIQAIDAANGDLIWEYAYPFPPDSKTLGGPTRNIAIYKDKLFLATYDAAVVALDARTGKQVWRTPKADYTKGYTHTAGPMVAGGVVVTGLNGCERYKKEGCFVTGHDPDTGRELWRTQTIAQPGDPNDASWAGLAPEFRAGGDTWIAGSYDPALGLYYTGTAQAKPWVAASRHMSPNDAALYTDSTLAIDPKTGKLAWYYQHVAGESLDMDTVFERVLVDIDGHPYVFAIGKDGILWKLDRATGKFVDFKETIYQNMFQSLDHATGKVKYRQDIIDAKIGDSVSVCPSIYGGHNWQASAYVPKTQSLIIPEHQLCVDFVGREVKMAEGFGGYGGESRVFEMPNAKGMLGRLSSWDLKTMSERWVHQQRAMFMTGVLTTGGGLAFVGDVDRYFKAFDMDTGKVLWQTRLGSGLHGYPITYTANGKQYVAVPTGMGVFKLMTARQSPEIYQPSGGNAIYVFEIGD